LKELWAIFDFACQGRLLGDRSEFLYDFESVILNGQNKNVSKYDKAMADQASEKLRNVLKDYLLRRDKESIKEVQEKNKSSSILENIQKNDFIVWLTLCQEQELAYLDFLQTEQAKEALILRQSILSSLNVLKKISDHPFLLQRTALEQEKGFEESLKDFSIIQQSVKMKFLIQLLPLLYSEGHRPLIFSQSKTILTMIGHILNNLVSSF
jgi:SNF2 family DNA or RNA helicase